MAVIAKWVIKKGRVIFNHPGKKKLKLKSDKQNSQFKCTLFVFGWSIFITIN